MAERYTFLVCSLTPTVHGAWSWRVTRPGVDTHSGIEMTRREGRAAMRAKMNELMGGDDDGMCEGWT